MWFWNKWKAEAQREKREKEIALDALRRNQEVVEALREQLKAEEFAHEVLRTHAQRSRRVEVARRPGLKPDEVAGGLRLLPGSEQYKAVNEVIDGLFVEENNFLLNEEGDVGAVRYQQGVAAGILMVKAELEEKIAEAVKAGVKQGAD